MYQAPSPTNRALLRQADRYALAIGALAGLIFGLLYTFEIWPGHRVVNSVFRMAGILLVVAPYTLIDELAFVDWLARVRSMLWIYAGLAALALLPSLIASQPFRWFEGSIIIGVSAVVFSAVSLFNERRLIKPKIQPD